jgi:OmpA-OmpF porin, OOP family
MKRFALSVILIALITGCKIRPAPNLMMNGGFDSIAKCPNAISQLRLAAGWRSNGSPDLFCSCSNARSVVYSELSFVGSLAPNSGKCYCGFIVNPRYKEYMTYELPKTLKRRKRYCISFLYARSTFSGMKMDRLGIWVHRSMYTNAARGQPMKRKTASVKLSDSPGTWSSASFTFVCGGGERFITLGSFDEDLSQAEYIPSKKNRKNVRIFNYAKSGYYFIEDVRLVELRKDETCLPVAVPEFPSPLQVPEEEPQVMAADTVILKSFVLHQLNFETARSEILPSSFDELDELAEYLVEQPELNLVIMGHTDDRGDEDSNMKLSEARARAVADYLLSKGVLLQRMKWEGFGESRPLTVNETEEGRSRNRRVEFLFE